MAGKASDPTDHADKLRYDLFPPSLAEVAKVYTIGAKKYGDNDYLEGMAWSRVISAMLRHLWDWIWGKKIDEDGFHPLGAVAWGCLTLMQYEADGLGEDDRFEWMKGATEPLPAWDARFNPVEEEEFAEALERSRHDDGGPDC